MSRRRRYDYADEDSDRGHKRRRISSEPKDIEDRLESLIMRVGEKSSSSLESNLECLASVLEADLPSYKGKILHILGECIVKMPEKITIYTTLVGLLNARNYNFGGEFVEMLVKNLKDAFKTCQWDEARSMVRFFSDLVNCHVIAAGSLIGFLENLVEVMREENIPQVRSDYFVYVVLSALPWVGRELYEKKDQELERLLKTIDIYITKRSKTHHAGLRVWHTDNPLPQEEYLECLWAQIVKMRSEKWVERHITRTYLGFDGVLCEALQHNLPPINPPSHHNDIVYPYPSVIFRLFDYTDCPDYESGVGPILPGAHSIERFLIEEQILRIIHQYRHERKECAAQLLSLPFKHKVPLEYMIVEVIFGEFFRLPTPNYIEICLGSLLLELCKLQPSTMPQVLAQTVELLFERIDKMSVDCVDRLASWFSYHLSNFQFRWTWDDWSNVATLDKLHPKPKFIQETLRKCLRLSYHENLKEIVPESFSSLLPLKPEPEYRYAKEGDNPGIMTAHVLESAIKAKCTPEDALAIIGDIPNPLLDDDGEHTHNPEKIDVFVQTLLNIACKSFSHSFAAIAKFHYVFKALSTSEEAQICVLRSMFEIWKNHQQILCVLVDKMLRIQILECSAVANWIFSREMVPEFTNSYIWEILHLTIVKMIKHVQKLQADLNEAKAKQDKSDDEDSSKEDSRDHPTVEMIEQMEDRLESAQSDQKNLFLIIFQRFIMILTEHIARCEVEGVDFNNHWFWWTVGRMREVFHQHHKHIYKYVTTLETLLFTADIDSHILSVFQQFCALRE